MLRMYTSNKGATLVEVLVSALILTLAVSGILFIFVQTLDMSKRVDHEYTAINLAKARMERATATIESSGFDSLPTLIETDVVIDESGGSDPEGEYKRSTTVTVLGANRTEFEVEVVYEYRGDWKDDTSTVLTTVFTSVR